MCRPTRFFALILCLSLLFTAVPPASSVVEAVHPRLSSSAEPGPPTTTAPPFHVMSKNGASCTEISFEGIANNAPIGTIAGVPAVTFGPSWLGLVDQDAGGTGDFANEPSPSTVAHFLTEVDPITFDTFVHTVEVWYTASPFSVPVTLSAWNGPNGSGQVVATATGNVDGTVGCTGDPTGVFCKWDKLMLTSDVNNIRSVTLAGALVNEFGFDDMTLCSGLAPNADFRWAPPVPLAATPVIFSDQSRGTELVYAWDFDGDGVIDDDVPDPVHTFATAGTYPVTLTVSNPYGEDTQTYDVVVVNALPHVMRVDRLYQGVFLDGVDQINRLDVLVDWQGSPGKLEVQVNQGPVTVLSASGPTVIYNLDLGKLPESTQPSLVRLTPTNGEGVRGDTQVEKVYVFPYPEWLKIATEIGGTVTARAGDGEIVFGLLYKYPKEPISKGCDIGCALSNCPKCIQVPKWVPLFGGTFDLLETQLSVEGSVSSVGTGSLSFDAKTGFFALGGGKAGGGVEGSASGKGEFRLAVIDGLDLIKATGELKIVGVLAAEAGIFDAIPGLQSLSGLPVLSTINKKVTLRGEIRPSITLMVVFAEKEDDLLHFDEITGTLGLDLTAVLDVNICRSLDLTGWASGGGSVTAGLPTPIFRQAEMHVEAGVKLVVWFWDFTAKARYQCTYKRSGEFRCGRSKSAPETPRLHLIATDIRRFGEPSRFVEAPRLRPDGPLYGDGGSVSRPRALLPHAVQEVTLLENVYAQASPAFTELPGGDHLLLWLSQDPSLPTPQSTELYFSRNYGAGWAAPLQLTDDRRADLAPQLASDSRGNAVAVWTRVRDARFDSPIEELEDLPAFLSRLDVVSAFYNTATGFWSTPVVLTNNALHDTDVQLSRATDGRLMLSWLQQPGGLFTSDAAHPATLRVRFWNAATRTWGPAQTVASGLVGVTRHAAAYRGDEAFAVLSLDPDPTTGGDEVLRLYTWDGIRWLANPRWAAGGGGNRAPQAAYDHSGTGHMVWLRGDNLVQATLDDKTPRPVRTGSSSATFDDLRLLRQPQGHLTLLWQEVTDDGPANLWAQIYDPGWQSWSEDLRLTSESDATHHDLTATYGTDGVLRAAYLRTQILRTEDTEVLDGVPVTFDNLPDAGRTDLRLLEHHLDADLTVAEGDLHTSPATPAVGDSVQATLQVHNTGALATGAFDVRLYVGDPDAAGVQVAEQRVDGPLVGGATVEVSLGYVQPAGDAELVAVVDAADEIDELLETNNRVSLALDNQAPFAVIIADVTSGAAPLTVYFDASGSLDPDGDSLRFSWLFADGASAVGAAVSHTFASAGSYPVSVLVTDQHGAQAAASVVITVTGDGGRECRLEPCT